jgi:hypothetical protein
MLRFLTTRRRGNIVNAYTVFFLLFPSPLLFCQSHIADHSFIGHASAGEEVRGPIYKSCHPISPNIFYMWGGREPLSAAKCGGVPLGDLRTPAGDAGDR